MFLKGIAASAGWAIAQAHVLTSHALTVAHRHIDAPSVRHEQDLLRAAFSALDTELAGFSAAKPSAAHPELLALVQVHRLMLCDPVLFDASLDYIANARVNAAWALSEQVQQLVASFEAMPDDYFAQRALDVKQVGQRILRYLEPDARAVDETRLTARVSTDKPMILVAQDLAPADFFQWQHIALAGLITEFGGPASHTAILARAHGIPAVLGIEKAAQQINDGDWLALNGQTGQVWVNPGAEQLALLQGEQKAWIGLLAAAQAQQSQPAITACGQAVLVLGNIEHPEDMPQVLAAGLDGVGLFRSEFLFLGRDTLPNEDEQYHAYRAVVQALAGKAATIRTLDVGGDKLLNTQINRSPSNDQADSHNPALGLRAVRYCLAHPELFKTQLRAMLRAAQHGPINVLLPMISTSHELLQCKHLLTVCAAELNAAHTPHGAVALGIMIEIPAAAIAIDTLLAHIDFCSVGTNDLIQYTLAIDRNDASVASLYDPAHPAITALLKHVFIACAAAGKPVSVCGEMASDTAHTHALLSMGLRQFSVNPSQAAALKASIRSWSSRVLI